MFAKIAQIKYIPDVLALASLWQKATNDAIPGFTSEQYDKLVDTAYEHVPASWQETAKKPEIKTVLVTGQAFYLGVENLVLLTGKPFYAAVKALFN